jgi:pseudouridine-5'-phosphate glycosidase
MKTHWELGMSSGIVFANPPPVGHSLSYAELESLIAGALNSAEVLGLRGKAVTPHLLQELARRSGGRTLRANIALLIENARVAARIAAAYCAEKKTTSSG